MSRRQKAELRRRCLEARERMTSEMVDASSRAVCRLLGKWPPFRQAQAVLSFLAFRNEIDLSSLFESWPEKHWLVPRIVETDELSSGQRPYLVLHPFHPQRLARHRFGMLEPEPDLPVWDPAQVDMALVPGVAFDRRGGRLGFGGGFYDRLLPLAHRSLRVGVTHKEFVLDTVPMESWDCRVQWLATPQGLINVQSA